MRTPRTLLPALFFAALALALAATPAPAYVEKIFTLSEMVSQSTHVVMLVVDKIDKERNLIVYRKGRDLKGTMPDVVKHNIGKQGFHPREWQYVMQWCEPGKQAVFMHNGGSGEVFIDNYWYQVNAGGEWWTMTHGEPYLLRTYAGRADKMPGHVADLLAGRDIVHACMVDGNKEDLHLRRAKLQRIKGSMKVMDYNAKRDFAGWGGEDVRRLGGVPAFSHLASLGRCDAEAQAVSVCDFDGDNKPDVALVGGGKVVLFQNGGDAYAETTLPYAGPARAAVWADYNLDGRPDLLLATPTGPRLLSNLGNNQFRDDSFLLPQESGYDTTAAAWLDYDADGRPDILLGNGYHGLRLYRNSPPDNAAKLLSPPAYGPWQYIGPFSNRNNAGFDTVYPPEKEIDFTKKYTGRGGQPVGWSPGKFTDGAVNSLKLFQPQWNELAAVYLYRRIDAPAPAEVPISLGSDDTLSVWLNGERLHHESVSRACVPDQVALTLKLKEGPNHLLLKVCQGNGEWAYYFKAGEAKPRVMQYFQDVSAANNLGPAGLGSDARGDGLSVADVNGDGRADFLYTAGNGLLALNTPKGFVHAANSGVSFRSGRVSPSFADADADGDADLFVPQADGPPKLFRNDGAAKFIDATGQSGDVAKLPAGTTSAAWGDFDGDGLADLFVGVLRGSNRYLRNSGGGKFEDATTATGLNTRVFNSQALALADFNGDGVLDLVTCNEGQDSALLLGAAASSVPKRFGVVVRPPTGAGPGSRVTVRAAGATAVVQATSLSGGDGRGGQSDGYPRFTLEPGRYAVEVRDPAGRAKVKEFTVSGPAKVLVE